MLRELNRGRVERQSELGGLVAAGPAYLEIELVQIDAQQACDFRQQLLQCGQRAMEAEPLFQTVEERIEFALNCPRSDDPEGGIGGVRGLGLAACQGHRETG